MYFAYVKIDLLNYFFQKINTSKLNFYIFELDI